MKKFLLSALLLAGAATASAQSFELYLSNEIDKELQVQNYKLIHEGDVFEVDGIELGEEFDLPGYYLQKAECMAYLLIENKTSAELNLSLGYTVEYNKNNSEELGDNALEYITCAGGTCVATNPFNVKVAAGGKTPGGYGEHLGFDISCNKAGIAEKLTLDAKYNFTLANGSEKLNFAIVYKSKDTGVAAIEANDAKAEYYNMQGIRVANPEAGQLYIVRKGGKTYKAIL